MRITRNHTAKTLAVALVSLLFLPGAKSGCASDEGQSKLRSPVQAVTTLLERADGTVDAELVLVSTTKSPNVFVDSAKNVFVRVPGGAEVPLARTSSGHYTATSKSNPALEYVPGQTYKFEFELDDAAAAAQVAGGNFVAVMDAPDDSPTMTLSEAPQFAGDNSKVTWTPSASRNAIIRVRSDATGEVTFDDFDFSKPAFDGSKWASLASGGSWELGVGAFPEAGSYTVDVCVVAKVSDFDTSISAELGWLSGFLIGRCAAPFQLSVGK